jgi:hypothetical protein
MRGAMLGFIFALGLAAPTGSQSPASLEAKYRRIVSYEVRPGIVLTPEYASDGKVCEMVFERRQKTETGFLLENTFSDKEVVELVDELVPSAERGKVVPVGLSNGRGPEGYVAGGVMTLVTEYQNVIVHVVGTDDPKASGPMYVAITWRNRACSANPAATKH